MILKFIFSEKATTFCEIFAVDLTVTAVEISQKIVAFPKYMNFTLIAYLLPTAVFNLLKKKLVNIGQTFINIYFSLPWLLDNYAPLCRKLCTYLHCFCSILGAGF